LEWVIRVSNSEVEYYWKNEIIAKIELGIKKTKKSKEDIKIIESILATIVAVISNRPSFNAEIFALQYGEWSPIFYYSINKLSEKFIKYKKEKLQVLYSEWKSRFEEVYQIGDVTEELFLKHTYLALMIRLVLFATYFPEEDLKQKSIIELTYWLEERGFSLFIYDFFEWAINDIQLLELLYYGMRPRRKEKDDEKSINSRVFEADDIFRTIYQQMVSPATRHALGEFYTPPELARMMVEEAYSFGIKTLDPACGS
ncbi:unnamed protein product, partial [marine sediment metagenome]